MADAATMTIKAVLLPDVIQKTLKDLTFAYTPADVGDKWYYKLVNVRHNASANLIEGNYLSKSTGVDTGATNAAVTTSDKVRFLFIKNTGTSDGSTSSDESIYVCFDGGSAAYNLGDAIEIGAGESWYGKLPNTTVGDINARTGDSGASSEGEASVTCMVVAILDGVA
tara:strand:- start:502 stop:1005 length:504 start_codon:yes stop_codon:yes gene_type:complete